MIGRCQPVLPLEMDNISSLRFRTGRYPVPWGFGDKGIPEHSWQQQKRFDPSGSHLARRLKLPHPQTGH